MQWKAYKIFMKTLKYVKQTNFCCECTKHTESAILIIIKLVNWFEKVMNTKLITEGVFGSE